MSEEINHRRRHFFRAAVLTMAAAQIGMINSVHAQAGKTRPTQLPSDQARDEHVVRPAEADRCGRAECWLRRGWARRWPCCHSSARLALRHPYICRCCAFARVGGLSRSRPVRARLWHNALSFKRDGPQRPTVGDRGRYRRLDGCPQDREGDHRRLRLGRANSEHHGGALAGAVQGYGFCERLSDRQPGSRQDAVAAAGRVPVVVPVLLCDGARAGRLRQASARVFEAHLAARFAEMGIR